ncbi:MAG: MGMT family protein [Granulosicoccaceae bacterium]
MPTNQAIPQLFNESVWQFVRQVPAGRVVSYGQIARAVSPPVGMAELDYPREGPRLVGSAMAACPDDVPWHRVVNAQGRVSSRAGSHQQVQLLEAEGLCFFDGRLDMTRVQWGEAEGGGALPQQQALF